MSATRDLLDDIATEVVRHERAGMPRPWRCQRGAVSNGDYLASAAEQFLQRFSSPELQVGRMPSSPATFRGRIGALLIRLIGRCLSWQTSQINEALLGVCELLSRAARRIEELESSTAALRAELDAASCVIRRLEGAAARPPGFDAFYHDFENAFRGSREEIIDRMREYLPRVIESGWATGEMPALDLGCGRGEWLELLRENGLNGAGVDLSSVCVDECRRRGLVADEADIIAFLERTPAANYGMITAFQVIEHLTFPAFRRLLDQAMRVLKPGGCLLVETPNSANLIVGSHTFYLDPTHDRPLPADLVRFTLEWRGFSSVEVIPMHPFPTEYMLDDQNNPTAALVNKWLFGPRDYAIIARRP